MKLFILGAVIGGLVGLAIPDAKEVIESPRYIGAGGNDMNHGLSYEPFKEMSEIPEVVTQTCPSTNVTGRSLPYYVAILPGQTCMKVIGDLR